MLFLSYFIDKLRHQIIVNGSVEARIKYFHVFVQYLKYFTRVTICAFERTWQKHTSFMQTLPYLKMDGNSVFVFPLTICGIWNVFPEKRIHMTMC